MSIVRAHIHAFSLCAHSLHSTLIIFCSGISALVSQLKTDTNKKIVQVAHIRFKNEYETNMT